MLVLDQLLTDAFDASNTNLSGTLDDIFCIADNPNPVSVSGADCGGSVPQVECSCCTLCCDDSTGDCSVELPQVCAIAAQKVAMEAIVGEGNETSSSVCDCTEDGTSFSCTDPDCKSCSEDGSVCGINSDYGFTFGEDGYIVSYNMSFQYVKGRNETVTFHGFVETFDCVVHVNGQQCSGCTTFACNDGSFGLFVDCNNIIPGPGGLYDTCRESHEDGGVLEVFHMYFTESFTGCSPALEPYEKLAHT